MNDQDFIKDAMQLCIANGYLISKETMVKVLTKEGDRYDSRYIPAASRAYRINLYIPLTEMQTFTSNPRDGRLCMMQIFTIKVEGYIYTMRITPTISRERNTK